MQKENWKFTAGIRKKCNLKWTGVLKIFEKPTVLGSSDTRAIKSKGFMKKYGKLKIYWRIAPTFTTFIDASRIIIKFNQLSDDRNFLSFLYPARTPRHSCCASKFLMLNRNKFSATFRQVWQTLEGVSTHKQTATQLLSIVARKVCNTKLCGGWEKFSRRRSGKPSDSQRLLVRSSI